jgi:YjbE family integral membrane protein
VQLLSEDEDEDDGSVKESAGLMAAVRTILIADLVMSLDNVIAVAAAAKGNDVLLLLGLAISIPLVIFGSTLMIKLMERFPIIIQLGAAVLAFTAAKMVVSEPLLDSVFDAPSQAAVRWATYVVAIVAVLGAGWLRTRKSAA